MREYDRWGEPRLRCPDCNGPMNMVLRNMGGPRGVPRWFCPTAIGEQAFDRERRIHYIPEPSEHKRVREWRPDDYAISSQLRAFSAPAEAATREEAEAA